MEAGSARSGLLQGGASPPALRAWCRRGGLWGLRGGPRRCGGPRGKMVIQAEMLKNGGSENKEGKEKVRKVQRRSSGI